MFGVFSCIGLLFIYFYVPETSGLSEAEKREIFMPGAKYGRKLREGEDCEVGYEHRSEMTIQQEVFRSFVDIIGRSASYDQLGNLSERRFSHNKEVKQGTAAQQRKNSHVLASSGKGANVFAIVEEVESSSSSDENSHSFNSSISEANLLDSSNTGPSGKNSNRKKPKRRQTEDHNTLLIISHESKEAKIRSPQ